MGYTTDRNDPRLSKGGTEGQDEVYLVLTEEELGKGFVRPFRDTYTHVGIPPANPLRDLTEDEVKRYEKYNYIKFEEHLSEDSIMLGRFWSQEQLDKASGCGKKTWMKKKLAETYARDPSFYGVTFCVECDRHIPVAEFVWFDGSRVGS